MIFLVGVKMMLCFCHFSKIWFDTNGFHQHLCFMNITQIVFFIQLLWHGHIITFIKKKMFFLNDIFNHPFILEPFWDKKNFNSSYSSICWLFPTSSAYLIQWWFYMDVICHLSLLATGSSLISIFVLFWMMVVYTMQSWLSNNSWTIVYSNVKLSHVLVMKCYV